MDPMLPHYFNLGTGLPQSLLSFAESQWLSWNAKGKILSGTIPHRTDEVWRYVPKIIQLPIH